jgi:hypothetical protein
MVPENEIPVEPSTEDPVEETPEAPRAETTPCDENNPVTKAPELNLTTVAIKMKVLNLKNCFDF